MRNVGAFRLSNAARVSHNSRMADSLYIALGMIGGVVIVAVAFFVVR
jgi:hypothetical protein